ncbi:MAG: leucyl aminopeptidase family protein, partial [Rhodomicrobium sp.]
MIFTFQDIADDISAVLAGKGEKAIPIRTVKSAEFQESPEKFVPPEQAAWIKATGWDAKPGSYALLPGAGGIGAVLFALGDNELAPATALQLGALPPALPEGVYALDGFPGSPGDAVLA